MTVSDLTGTSWLINETPTLSVTDINELFYIQGKELISTSNGTSHSTLMPSGFSAAVGLYYDPVGAAEPVYTPTGGWADEAYRTISITGGSDATYPFFISWLEANATQIVKYPNKVVYDGNVLIDLTGDTVTSSVLAQGYTAHDASGAPIVGSMSGAAAIITDTVDSHGGTIREITTSSEVYLTTKSVTPTESQQTVVPGTGYDAMSSVTVGAIPSDYVGSGITSRSSTDLTTSGATVTAPAGYYASSANKSVASGSATTPSTSITANPSISVNSSTGLITATTSASKSVTPTVSVGYVSSGTAGTVSVSGSNTSQLSTQAGTTVNPTTSEQTVVAAGKYTTGAVKVRGVTTTQLIADNVRYGKTVEVGVSGDSDSIASVEGRFTYQGSITYGQSPATTSQILSGYSAFMNGAEVKGNIATKTSSNLSASGATVTAPAGYYASDASKSVASGTAGTPTATKGTVSNHSISVTPSVTNTTGYITGGTNTGTAVTVSASELVSGSETKTDNGTYDVTNLAQLIVNVSSGGGATLLGTYEVSASTSSTTQTGLEIFDVSGVASIDTLILGIVTDKAGARNGYFYSSVTVYWGAQTSNVIRYGTRYNSDGTYTYYSSQYGVYCNTITSNTIDTDGSFSCQVAARYNQNYTGTINGTYSVKFYAVPLSSLR